MAEHFRDEKGLDVLCLSIISLDLQSGSEIKLLWKNSFSGWIPTNISIEMGKLQERITSTSKRFYYFCSSSLRTSGWLNWPSSASVFCTLRYNYSFK